MTDTRARNRKGGTGRKVFAIVAACAVAGIGASGTLAAWTDNEWVFGAAHGTKADTATGGDPTDADPGVGTSKFNVLSNVFDGSGFIDHETAPGGGLTFTQAGGALAPGDSTYAEAAFKTAADSVATSIFKIKAAVETDVTNDADQLLFDALTVRVLTSKAQIACNAAAFTTPLAAGVTKIVDGPLSTATDTGAGQLLAAAGADAQYYCFELTLPETFTITAPNTIDDYQGRSVVPVWEFDAES